MGRGYKSSRASAHTRDSIRSKPRAPPEFDPADAKIVAINSYEDVADEVDDFHLQRDKVLLDDGGSRAGRKGRGRDADEESEVEEVYGLGTDEDEDEDEDEDDEDLEEYATTDEEEEGDRDEKSTKRARGAATLSDDDDEEDQDDEEDDVEGWGTSKSAYYGGNEGEITTEQDAFDEEAEARRIQKKQLASMVAEDFMLDLDEWSSSSATKPGSAITTKKTAAITKTIETLPTAIPSDLSPSARLSLLKSRNPEFEPLSAEFLELQRIYPVLAAQAERGREVSQVRYKALAAYLGVLAMYFALLSRDQTGSWTGVKAHGIMDGLVRCRELWERVKGLDEEEEEEEEEGSEQEEQPNGVDKDVDMVDGELDSVYDEEEVEEDTSPEPEPVRKQLVVSNGKPTAPRKRAKLDLGLDTPTTTTKIPSKSTRAIPTTATDLSDLSALIPTSKFKYKPSINQKAPHSSTKPKGNNDFTDPTTLSTADLSEKSSRKSSLRFHASQLLSKSALRAQAGRHAGGDTDLPRKDKHPERSSIVKRDQSLGDDLDLEEPSAEDKSLAKSINGPTDELDDDLDHYHLLASQSRKSKRSETGPGGEFTRFPTEKDTDGKRAIGYTIEKNKGLTPHRKKEVRNPRVKKRMAYEKAKKKLRTVKRVYSGPSQGAYAGEMTGIKKGIVRSRRLK